MRAARPLIVLAVFALVAIAAVLVVSRYWERRIGERLVSSAQQRGIALSLSEVRLSIRGTVELRGVRAEKRGRGRFTADRLVVGIRPRLAALRSWIRTVRYEGAALSGPGGMRAALADATWEVTRLDAQGAAAKRVGLPDRVNVQGGPGNLELTFTMLDLGHLARVTRDGRALLSGGTAGGHVRISRRGPGIAGVELLISAHGARLPAAFREEDEPPSFGPPIDLDAAVTGELSTGQGWVDVDCARVSAAGVTFSGEGRMAFGEDDAWFDLGLDVPSVELAPLFAASGMDLPADVGPMPPDLGAASLLFRATGQLTEPDSIAVEEQLNFRPPPQPIPALERLKGPFTHTVLLSDGSSCRVEVREGSPDFIPLDDVPPLFVRTLTIAEDAGFWGHHGLDLQEIPVAFATNWVRGTKARGASTITQQLAKNLFLSREKSYRRKLQEVALTLLLESTLGKRRILEIYLNVIEWGPGVYGLRPAARRYFGKEPRDLTPKEIVFLVSLIPGPVRYQRSFEQGAVTSRFNVLLVNLLAKLRSVDALTEEEYQQARDETLVFNGRPTARGTGVAASQ